MFARCSSSTSNTAKSEFAVRAAATPRSRLDPETLVVTEPKPETILTNALVVEVFPFVPETQIIVRFFDSSEIARGLSFSRTHPAIVSPDLRRIFRESSAANFAAKMENFNLTYFLKFLATTLICGAPGRDRTDDLLVTNELLYH